MIVLSCNSAMLLENSLNILYYSAVFDFNIEIKGKNGFVYDNSTVSCMLGKVKIRVT